MIPSVEYKIGLILVVVVINHAEPFHRILDIILFPVYGCIGIVVDVVQLNPSYE